MANQPKRRFPGALLVSIHLTILALLVDLYLPLGIAAAVPYLAVILATLWLPGTIYTWFFAGLCTLATAAVLLLPVSGNNSGSVLANRGLALFAIWSTALLCVQRKRFEHELEESRRQYQSLYEDAPLAYFSVDHQGRIKMVNAAATELLGFTREELTGRPVLDCYAESPDGKEKAARLRQRFLEGKKILAETLKMQRKDGSHIWVSLTVRPIMSANGRILESRSIVQDLTALHEAQGRVQTSEEHTQAIVNTVIDGIITIDATGMIETFNPAAAKLFGYEPEDVIGRNVRILMPEPDSGRHDQYIQRYLKSGEARIIGIGREVTARKKDGTEFPVHLGVAMMKTKNRTGFVGTIRDLTEYKRMQSELQWTREYAALGEMATSVAHQIKNPLAAVNGVLKVLLDSNAVTESYREVVQELIQRTADLDTLVRRLFVFAKPWNPEKRQIDLRELAAQVALSAQREETFSRIQFNFEGEEKLVGMVDPLLVQDLLWNILYNSAHAMPDGGAIAFHFGRRNDELCLDVIDTGPGIPREVMEKLFRPFFTTKHRGTGLGLFICRKIIRAHGGSISVSSQKGRGTRVSLCFPTAQQDESGIKSTAS